MHKPTCNAHMFKRTLLSMLVASCFPTGAALAQENDEMLEEIIVLGTFQRNLQNSLEIKRNSQNIVDGISADDIDALPALDMGEALQAVVGVQLNREGERRESSINLRGLPSGFVKNTVNGQSIASPTRSEKTFGAPTPFGAYDPAVFDGIDVYKSQSANFQEGGIAGIVNYRVARALDQEDGGSVSYGIRKEMLADANDEEVKATINKHLIEDTLAFTGTVAWSQQNFRRDTIKINRYDPLTEAGATNGTTSRFAHPTLGYDAWMASQGLSDANDIVYVPGELRQNLETNSGDRLSYTANLEYSPMEELTIGLSTLYTHRDMDRNGFEALDVRTRYADAYPLTDAVSTGLTEGGKNVYTVSDIRFGLSSADLVDGVNDSSQGPRYAYDSRAWLLDEYSRAMILDVAWERDNFKVTSVFTRSDAWNEWNEVLIAPRNENLADNDVTGILRTGAGEISDFEATLENYHQAIDLDNITWNLPRSAGVFGSGLIGSSVPAGSVHPSILMTGTWERIDRDMSSMEFNVEYSFDDFPITSVELGFRSSSEDEYSTRYRNSPVGIDPTGRLNNRDLVTPSYANGSTFFGGEAPRYGGADDGWFTFDVFEVWDRFVNSIDFEDVKANSPANEQPIRLPTGFIARGGLGNRIANYESTIDTTAFYGKVNYEIDLNDVVISGNAGFRSINDEQETVAPFYAPDGSGSINLNQVNSVSSSRDFSTVLPSLNVNVEFLEDFVARLGYENSIVRPNNRAFTPTAAITIGGSGDTVSLDLPPVNIDPFEASLLNLSFEWYNREGSSLSLAFFQVSVENFFAEDEFCDSAALAGTNIDIGTLATSGTNCVTTGNASYGINANALVDVSRIGNIDSTIDIQGFELSAQQNLDFLPEPWDGLGGVFNYSKTDQDADNDQFIPGISDDTFNLIVFYEQDTYGVRLAYNYRSDYDLDSIGTFNGDGEKSVKAAGRLDLSAYYDFTENLTISLKGYNLTEALYEEYEEVEYQPRATHFDGRTFVLSATYNF